MSLSLNAHVRWSHEELLNSTPSRRDGISYESEMQTRSKLALKIQEAGIKLKYPQTTIALAIFFMHIFLCRQSLVYIDVELLGQVCLFLAGKVDESPRKARDVINVFYSMQNPTKGPLKIDDEFSRMRELVIANEQLLLRTLKYKVNLDLPYRYLYNYLRALNCNSGMAQIATNFINDTLGSTLMLEFDPHIIAAAAIFLSSKILRVDFSHVAPGVQWYTVFDISYNSLEEVAVRMLDYLEKFSPLALGL